MGDRGERIEAGSARRARQVGRAWVRPVVGGVLALSLVLGGALAAASWDGDRMVRAAAAYSQRTEQSARLLRELIQQLPSREPRARLVMVNDHFNRSLDFGDDREIWQSADHWASPIETLAKGAGDCEDFAIAKYFTLVAGGVPVASLRLVYVRAMVSAGPGAPARSQAHMVLAHYDGGVDDPLILDNLVPQIRRASERPDLTPVFSFNGEGLWQGAGTLPAGDPMVRLSRWREVVRKARLEGFE